MKTSTNQPARLVARVIVALVFSVAFAATLRAQVPVFSNIWVVVGGTYPDLPSSAGNNVRGIAINPLTTNVLFASTTGGTNNGANHAATLSFANGSNYLACLSGSGISGGTLALDQIRVSDDGYVYACNLSSAPVSNFKIYRWPSDSDVNTAPTVVYNSGAGTSFQWRIGDYMDLRGSGLNTEIVAVGSTTSGANITTNFVIFRPTDAYATNFTNFSITIPGSSATANLCGAGVAFEGTNNAIWVRRPGGGTAGQETRRVAYDPVTLTATVTATNTVDQSACQGLKYISANGVNMLATVQATSSSTSPNICRVFQIPSNPTAALISVFTANLPPPFASNGNALGAVDAAKGYLIFGAPGNALAFYQINFITNSPPSVNGPTGGGTVVEGLITNTFTVTVTGTSPFHYQWYFNTNTPVGSNTNFLTLSPVHLGDAGDYQVVVTNAYGSVTSGVASLTVLPNGASLLATQSWSVAPGSRDYVANDNSQRGLGYDPINQRVVLVSRTPTNGLHLLDAATGADAGEMDVSLLSVGTPPGTFAINMCGVADDGAVYVCNLITSGTADTFAIYRWDSATPSATMGAAYLNNPGVGRIGDTMAVRGAGTNTEILCSFRTGTNVAIFNTTDGANFNFNSIAVTNLPADAQANGFAGLGIAFGSGNTFWAKSSGFNLRQVQYDVASGSGWVINTYTLPTTESVIGVDAANDFLAEVGTVQQPQTLPIYDLDAPGGPSLGSLVDREVFPANNSNGNGTGAVAFDVAGGRLFALDSNCGVLGLRYAPRLRVSPFPNGSVVTWTGPGALQSATNVVGSYSDVLGATSPHTNTAAGGIYFRVRR